MRKNTLILSMFLAGTTTLFAQVPKIPLIESFSQASCGPCAPANAEMLNVLNTFGEANYVRVSHQVHFPGDDIMNEEYPAGPLARMNYYGVQGVPSKFLNGTASEINAGTLATAANDSTPYNIAVTQSWADPNTVTVDVNVSNTTAAEISSADKIFVTMLEKQIDFPTAPGSNGESSFRYVMRQMYDATTGTADATTGATLGAIAANGTQNFNFTINSLPSYLRGKGEVLFAVYIQNDASKVIYQAGKSAIVPIPGLISVAATSNSTSVADFCDYSFTPSVNFTNNDANTAVTEVVAEYTINGGTAVSQTFTGNLTNGQSTTIDFPATTLAGGQNIIQYTIVSVNGGQDWASSSAVSFAPETYNKLNTTGMATPFSEGFESVTMSGPTTRIFTNGIMNTATSIQENAFSIIDGPANQLGAVGGFAASNKCVYFGCYGVDAGGVMDVVLQKLNIGTETFLSFDHSYVQYQAENDKLEVFASTDCGTTWTSVFNKAGNDLKTGPASQDFYAPTSADQWVRNEVDLSAFANTNDVVLKFAVTSDWGNNIFVDNIYLGQSIASVEDLKENSFSVYPNPATDMVSVQLSEGLSLDFELNVYDMKGQVVKTINVTAGTSKVDVNTSDLKPGVYAVHLNGTTSRLIIQ